MPFLTGTTSAIRFRTPVSLAYATFGDAEVAALAKHNADARPLSDSKPQHGWAAGTHELDLTITAAKCLRGPYMHWGFRVTTNDPPAGRVKTLAQAAFDRAEESDTPIPWDDAVESAESTVQEEAKDGRYTKHTLIPVVWDGERGQVWYGSGSAKWVTLFTQLFKDTFGVDLEPITAGTLAPTEVNAVVPEAVWCPDGADVVGNEFLMWLLCRDDNDLIGLTTVMAANSVSMACPFGQGGRDEFRHECPARMPELVLAARKGKVARKAGLTLASGDGKLFTATLQAETWAVTGGKLPDADEDLTGEQADVARLDLCRQLFDELDGLIQSFVQDYAANCDAVKRWLQGGE